MTVAASAIAGARAPGSRSRWLAWASVVLYIALAGTSLVPPAPVPGWTPPLAALEASRLFRGGELRSRGRAHDGRPRDLRARGISLDTEPHRPRPVRGILRRDRTGTRAVAARARRRERPRPL